MTDNATDEARAALAAEPLAPPLCLSDFETLQGIALDMVESLRPIVIPEILGVLRKAIKQLPAPTPPADGEVKTPEEVRAAFAELERRQENLRNFRQLRAALATPTPPADGEVEELAAWLEREADCAAKHSMTNIDSPEDLRRAAALLRQLPPVGLWAEEYFHPASGARIVRDLVVHSGEPGECWTVRNSRHVNPCTEFSTLAAASAALQQTRREKSDD